MRYIYFKIKTNIFLISFLDKEPPKITCPKDMEVIKTGPGHTTVVHWHPPTADDNSGGHVVLFTESVADSGFTVGRHRITYKATDPSGNKASCTFTITVLSEQGQCYQFWFPKEGRLGKKICTGMLSVEFSTLHFLYASLFVCLFVFYWKVLYHLRTVFSLDMSGCQ